MRRIVILYIYIVYSSERQSKDTSLPFFLFKEMKTIVKILLTVILVVVIYLLSLLPVYLIGIVLVNPLDYFFAFCIGIFMWAPILGLIYFAYNIVNDLIK